MVFDEESAGDVSAELEGSEITLRVLYVALEVVLRDRGEVSEPTALFEVDFLHSTRLDSN